LKWWACSDLNRGPSDYESPALTAELQAPHIETVGIHFGVDKLGGKLIRKPMQASLILKISIAFLPARGQHKNPFSRGVA
jgi:hypothetical protein